MARSDEVVALVSATAREAGREQIQYAVVALLDIPPLEYLAANADRVAYRLAQHWAGRLVAEDAHQHGVLLETLEAYFAAELNVQRTAKRLNVHANSVQNRLRRVGVLTGRQMRRLHDLVQVLTAVRLLRSME